MTALPSSKTCQLPEYYTMFARKIFFSRIWGGATAPLPPPVSYAYDSAPTITRVSCDVKQKARACGTAASCQNTKAFQQEQSSSKWRRQLPQFTATEAGGRIAGCSHCDDARPMNDSSEPSMSCCCRRQRPPSWSFS